MSTKKLRPLFAILITCAACGEFCIADASNVPYMEVGVFDQEISAQYSMADGLAANNVLSILVDDEGAIYAGTSKGISVFDNGTWNNLTGIPSEQTRALCSHNERVFAAVGGDLYEITENNPKKMTDRHLTNINDLAAIGDILVIGTAEGLFRCENGTINADQTFNSLLENEKVVYSVAVSQTGDIALGAEAGLFLKSPNSEWKALYPQSGRRSWAPRSVRGVTFDGNSRLWFACPQGVGCFDGKWALYTGEDGLPYDDFTCLRCGEDGSVWFGTTIGAIRYNGEEWAYRQGKRWLPDDRVNDIAVATNGNAWFATPDGVGAIKYKPMTLAEKAEFYEEEIEKYIKRTEYGYTSEVHLPNPGDKSRVIRTDSDNDGLWTSMYGAGECFAYAATKDPKAKERAKEAFEALRFLSVVTQGGEVDQQPGFVARTVVPTTEPDPNQHEAFTLEGMKRRRETLDARWKVYYPRWPLGKDGKYWYKTDTSSDELDGHFFFYPLYYDLVAETEEEKERVQEVVRNIADHLIRNDFCLVDHDGTPTRWAVFRPSLLNHDPWWYPERGLNSLSILSYLAVAEYVTGDPRYGVASNTLIAKHSYDMNAMVTKIQYGLGSGNQSDDEMAFMSYYNLIKYTRNEKLRNMIMFSFYNYWILEFPEMNPFFNFAYAEHGLNAEFSDPWGTHSLPPWDGWLEDSVETLKGFPLDRLNWAHKNSHRTDIILLPRQAAVEPTERPGHRRGHRVNGKVLPVEERHFNHWNTDPWRLDYGGNGGTLASGTVYLLPYYMGLYHGFIR